MKAVEFRPLEYDGTSDQSHSCHNYRAVFRYREVEDSVILEILHDPATPGKHTALIFDSERAWWKQYDEEEPLHLESEDDLDQKPIDIGEMITSKKAQESAFQLLEAVKKVIFPANQGQVVVEETVSAL